MTRLLTLSVLVALAGCDVFGFETDDPPICTTEYVTYAVEVVGPDGAPMPVLDARSVVVSTGAVLDRPDGPTPDGGTYYVVTDGNARELPRDPTRLRFTAENDSLRASADYVVGFDGCHVSLVSGPSRIVATGR